MAFAPFTQTLRVYKGMTYAYQQNFTENGSDLDLTTVDDIEVRLFNSNGEIFSHSVSGGELTISGSNNESLAGTASDTTMDIAKRSYYQETIFKRSDGTQDVYVAFQVIVIDAEDQQQQTAHEWDITIDTDAETVSGEQLTGLTALALQYRDEAEGFANNLDRASIQSGDAGKYERVKQDESGWEIFEKFDQPTFLTKASVEEETANTHTVWEFQSSESESENFIFSQGTFDVNQSFTRKNVDWAWGYNQLVNGTRVNDSQAGLAWRMESFYEISGTPYFEVHLQNISPAGQTTRPLSFTIGQDESDYRQVIFDVDDFRIIHKRDDGVGGRTTDDLLNLQKSNQLASWKYGQAITQNNINALSQRNAADSAYITLMKLNDSDVVEIGGSSNRIDLQQPVLGRIELDDPSNSQSEIIFKASRDHKIISEGAENTLFLTSGVESMRIKSDASMQINERLRLVDSLNFNPAPTTTSSKSPTGEYLEITVEGGTRYLELLN